MKALVGSSRRRIASFLVGLVSLVACIDVSGLRGGGDARPRDDAAADGPAEASVPPPGSCDGRDCLGGSCDAGVCGPVAIATGESAIAVDLALSTDHVFFTVINDMA